jgi:predicted RecB family nuclease
MSWRKAKKWTRFYGNFIVWDKMKTTLKKTIRTCKNGHQYYKSSDCSTCPTCEEAKRPQEGFLSLLYAPARRALENANIRTLKQLSKHSENDILNLHGIGKTTIPILKRELKNAGLTFND